MLDQAFQALADPTRRAILERLDDGPASVSELAQPFTDDVGGGRPARAGARDRRRSSGRRRSGGCAPCSSTPAGLRSAEDWLAARRTRTEHQLDRLAALLAEPTSAPSAATRE